MIIFCTGCGTKVEARLTDGAEIYPHRPDLFKLPFWKCDACKNYVGCHHKTGNPTQPLGCIPTKEITAMRKKIHAVLDPLWQRGGYNRKELYKILSERMGGKHKYHTAQIRSVDEARQVLDIIDSLKGGKNG
jgi:hypothetical protein